MTQQRTKEGLRVLCILCLHRHQRILTSSLVVGWVLSEHHTSPDALLTIQ